MPSGKQLLIINRKFLIKSRQRTCPLAWFYQNPNLREVERWALERRMEQSPSEKSASNIWTYSTTQTASGRGTIQVQSPIYSTIIPLNQMPTQWSIYRQDPNRVYYVDRKSEVIHSSHEQQTSVHLGGRICSVSCGDPRCLNCRVLLETCTTLGSRIK